MLAHLPGRSHFGMLVLGNDQPAYFYNAVVVPFHMVRKAYLPACLLCYFSFVSGPQSIPTAA